MNRVLEVLIAIVMLGLGGVAFVQIMTPSSSSVLYQLDSFLRFGLFTLTLFLLMYFIANPLFKRLSVKKLSVNK